MIVLITSCGKKEDLHKKVFEEINLTESTYEDFMLPSKSTVVDKAILSWTSDHEAIVVDGDDAVVTQHEEDVLVNLTLKVTIKKKSKEKVFEVLVLKLEEVIDEPETYEVVFKDYNGEILLTVNLEAGESATPPEVEEREGYTFVEWVGNYKNVNEDSVVTAKYEQKEYEVTFKYEDGEVISTLNVLHGEDATPPEVEEQEGYTFVEWVGNYKNVKANSVVTAKYEQKEYEVIFKYEDGKIISTLNVLHGEEATPPEPEELDGYNFIEWVGNYVNVKEDTTVVAHYELIEYNIYYYLPYNSTTNNPTTYTILDEVILEDPTYGEGLIFKNWGYYDKETMKIDTHSNIYGSIPEGSFDDQYLAPIFELIEYDITYLLNGGTNHKDNKKTYTIESSFVFDDAEKFGYIFLGWIDENDEEISSINKGTYGELTISALWQPVTICEMEIDIKTGKVFDEEMVIYESFANDSKEGVRYLMESGEGYFQLQGEEGYNGAEIRIRLTESAKEIYEVYQVKVTFTDRPEHNGDLTISGSSVYINNDSQIDYEFIELLNENNEIIFYFPGDSDFIIKNTSKGNNYIGIVRIDLALIEK